MQLSRRDSASVAAVIFDVDGTLYRQSALRRAMLFRLVRAHVLHPRDAVATFRILWSYRGAHEQLRRDQLRGDGLRADGSTGPAAMLEERQLMLTAGRAGYPVAAVRRTIEKWIERSPLDLMLATRWSGVVEYLKELRGTGILIGAWSDYPATAKLTAMGLSALFDVVVCAQDSDVGRLKPDPAGLRIVLARLDMPAEHAVYVGDRPDLDAGAASAAGVRCYIIGRAGARGSGWTGVRDYTELRRLLANDAA
jgi:FMN phosphatase YigB (HAD superfamily)